jgi:hypothetical protein
VSSWPFPIDFPVYLQRRTELSEVLAAFGEVGAEVQLIFILCMKRISTKILYKKDGASSVKSSLMLCASDDF